MKSIASINLYMISVCCFVIAHLIREQYRILYYILIILGILLFFVGFKNRTNNKS
jgi:hypothetical protein